MQTFFKNLSIHDEQNYFSGFTTGSSKQLDFDQKFEDNDEILSENELLKRLGYAEYQMMNVYSFFMKNILIFILVGYNI